MRKNKWKSKIITIVLAVAMVLAFFGVLPCTDSVPDAKAVSGDEGSDGLTLIDNCDRFNGFYAVVVSACSQ